MPSPTALSLDRLRRNGYIACVIERWIESLGIRKDAFGFGDVLAAHPVRREVLLVQATSISNIAARLVKARSKPELRAWLAAGASFQVWGWERRRSSWEVKIVEVRAADLAEVLITRPPRRGRRSVQHDLFDSIDPSTGPERLSPSTPAE